MPIEPLAFPPPAPGDPWGDTPLSEIEVIALDTETGGLDAHRDPLLTVGLAGPDGLVLEASVLQEHYQPDPRVLDVNRITSQRAAWGLPWPLIEELLVDAMDGRVVCAHNAGFDLSFLVANAASLALPPAIDTAACCRFLWPGEKAGLAALAQRARIDPGVAHGAGADACTCARGWLFLRAALIARKVTTWRQLCEAQAPIPPSFERRPWPEQVAAVAGRVTREGATVDA